MHIIRGDLYHTALRNERKQHPRIRRAGTGAHTNATVVKLPRRDGQLSVVPTLPTDDGGEAA